MPQIFPGRGSTVLSSYIRWSFLALASCSAPAPESPAPPEGTPPARPRYTEAGELLRPQGTEDWVFVGSSMGLDYSEGTREDGPGHFQNVFMEPAAFAEYASTGRFPEKTMFALVIHEPRQRESIGRQGWFSGDLVSLEVSVKDSERFPESWAYFDFGKDRGTATAKRPEACHACHLEHGKDNVFVQFYPRLRGLPLR